MYIQSETVVPGSPVTNANRFVDLCQCQSEPWSIRLIQHHVLCILQSFGLGWAVGSQPLFWALFISFVLGTAYSINVRAHASRPGTVI
jgi:hypothetical protein